MEIYLFLFIIGLLFYHQYKYKSLYPQLFKENEKIKELESKISQLSEMSEELKQDNEKIKNEKINNEKINLIIDRTNEQRDIDVIQNPVQPPERRNQRHIQHPINLRRKINIPTRGYPDNYQVVGLLVGKKGKQMLNLFGRQKYPGSSQWEYYAMGNDRTSFPVKLPIEVRGDKELYDKDTIKLNYMNNKKFKVKLYDYNTPRYIPHI